MTAPTLDIILKNGRKRRIEIILEFLRLSGRSEAGAISNVPSQMAKEYSTE